MPSLGLNVILLKVKTKALISVSVFSGLAVNGRTQRLVFVCAVVHIELFCCCCNIKQTVVRTISSMNTINRSTN